MKILAFADMHSDKEAQKVLLKAGKDVDMIICAGDISWFGEDLKKILKAFDKLKVQMFIIPGNHEDEGLEELCKKTKHITYAHKALYQHKGYSFLFYGLNGFSTKDEYAKKFFDTAMKDVKKNQIKIFVSHGPPYGTKLDDIKGEHCGDKELRKAIKKYKPQLFICGHFHDNFGKQQVLKQTLMINPGPTGKILEI
tara:strand:+ start:1527 stop:2114 length:588 start_codon:yes stop_codon:yes gene_type:complete